jgi:hypothetical protein
MDEKKPTSGDAPHRTKQGEVPPRPPKRRIHWIWPVGLAVAGLGGVAAFMMRGCWHTQMGWPIAYDEQYSYQVCTDCGIKRLFDEKSFHAYGPYGYDLHELIAGERAARLRQSKRREEFETRKAQSKRPEPVAAKPSGTEA